jgi:hypothetical protein
MRRSSSSATAIARRLSSANALLTSTEISNSDS